MKDPNTIMYVCKHDGKEVGRIAATASNAKQYIDELARNYGGLQIEYVEDADEAMMNRLMSPPKL